MVSNPAAGVSGGYTRAVLNDKVFGPHPLSGPLALSGVVDLAAGLAGGYLLLFQGASGDPQRLVLFVQELDARGVPQGAPVAVTEEGFRGVSGAVAGLPDGRWLVITRSQQGESPACTERLVGRVFRSGD